MIVGFCGYPYNGKTEAAKRLVDNHGFARINFADAVKRMILQLEGVQERHVYGTKQDKEEIIIPLGASARYLMETLGTKWGRDMIKPSLWVDQAMEKALRLTHYNQTPVVFDDVRFHNEVNAIKNTGGIIIRIERPSIIPDLTLPANRDVFDLQQDWTIINSYDGPEWQHRLEGFVLEGIDAVVSAKKGN